MPVLYLAFLFSGKIFVVIAVFAVVLMIRYTRQLPIERKIS